MNSVTAFCDRGHFGVRAESSLIATPHSIPIKGQVEIAYQSTERESVPPRAQRPSRRRKLRRIAFTAKRTRKIFPTCSLAFTSAERRRNETHQLCTHASARLCIRGIRHRHRGSSLGGLP